MSDYFDQLERQLVTRIEASAPGAVPGEARRRRPGRRALSIVASVGAVAVVAVVVAVIVLSGGRARHPASPPAGSLHRHVTVTLQAPASTTSSAMQAAAGSLSARLHALAIHATVAVRGRRLEVQVMSVGDGRLVLQLAAPGRLTFYDWEADVLLPSGRTDASQLSGDRYVDQLALTLSQGADATGPGSAREGAGAMTLYRAVALAARGPHDRTAAGRPTLYRFARAASPACAALARDDGAARIGEVTESGHCLVAGPASTVAQLRAELPAGIAPDAGRQLTVGPGRTVLAAESPGAVPVATASSAARFYVLRDRPALSGRELTDVRVKTSETGEPGVGFGFTAAGAHAFRDLTATIAHRGRQVTLGSDQLYQHFAIALDGRLVSVPSIDFNQYPDGILPAGSGGGEIAGGLTRASARQLAAILRAGPIGVALTPVSSGP